jgi:chromosome-anchoring protein RacA
LPFKTCYPDLGTQRYRKGKNGGNFGNKNEECVHMNSSEVANLLEVSVSTIQRWVKQLNLPMNRNERGHYSFNQEDIELLKRIKEQIQNGALLQDIAPIQEKQTRKGTIKSLENEKTVEKLTERIRELEINLNTKADSVASYQLLQHRREIEDLQCQVKEMTKQLETVQNQLNELIRPSKMQESLIFDHGDLKRKKKNIVRSIFGF